MSKAEVTALLQAWREGRVCLHPTDTLPGLSFDPTQAEAWQTLLTIKQRPSEKSPIALIASIETGQQLWEALPGSWASILRDLWPSPLSVVWRARASCPPFLKASDGTCALRLPSLPDAWMNEALLKSGVAFPTTSINRSGEAPCQTWDEAVAWVKRYAPEVFVPALPVRQLVQAKPGLPSTVLRIVDARTYEILREGAVARSHIEHIVETYVRDI